MSGLPSLLDDAVNQAAPAMREITEGDAARPDREGAWSRKQELGHLIDSAANNHQRIVRAALEGEFRGPGYDQNGWVALHDYAARPWAELIGFWEACNRLLAGVVARVPEDRWTAPCTIGDGAPMTLSALVEDYVRHLRHHLDHILKVR
jgi:hypothetical protein